MKVFATLKSLSKKPIFWVLVLAFVLRMVGAGWGLPQLCFYFDERLDIGEPLKMLKNKDIEPTQYVVPPGYSYHLLPVLVVSSGETIAASQASYT